MQWNEYFLRHHIKRLHCRNINASVFDAKLHLAVVHNNFCVLVLLQWQQGCPFAWCCSLHRKCMADLGRRTTTDNTTLLCNSWRGFLHLLLLVLRLLLQTTRSVQNYLGTKLLILHIYMYSHTHHTHSIIYNTTLHCYAGSKKMHPDFKDPSVFGTLLFIACF